MKIAIHRDKSLHALLIILLACLIIISGCGSGGGGDNNNSSVQNSNYIYGIASKGPINNGLVAVYPLDANGTQGKKVLGIPTVTDVHGSYVINIGSYTGNLLVEVKGGEYKDEATGDPTENGLLRAAVTNIKGNTVVIVTPFTEIAYQKALADGGLTTDKIDNANLLVSSMAGGVNIINTSPVDVTNAESLTSAGPEEITYGLALAAISEMVNNKYAGNMSDAIVKISNDLSDNKLDSQAGYLKDSLLAFLSNPNNQSGVTDLSQTNIDESFDLLSNPTLASDSNDINQLFKELESLYGAQHSPLKDWFNYNIADDYLHDGRVKEDEYDVWTGPGGLYDGITISVILLAPLDVPDSSYKKGYRIRIYFSGEKGWGNVTSSMVYDDTESKWLWYGNQEWGVNLWNFQPTAEMTVDATEAVSFRSGLDVLIWDVNLSAYDHGIRSAIITGPGLPAEGLILKHLYPAASYFSLLDQSHGSLYPLSEMDQSSSLDNAEYTVRFYTQSAGEASPADQPVKTETRVFAKGPVPETELSSNSLMYFPDIISPTHDLSSVTIPGTSDISWNNPDNMAVDYAELRWIDANGKYKSISLRPETDPLIVTNPITATFDTSDTTKYTPVDLTAQLYMQGNDTYGRRFSVNWELWKQAGLPEDVIGINNVFNTLEGLYSAGSPDAQVITDWFNDNVAHEYLHDGRNRDLDRSVWSGTGGLYEGISISAVLLEKLAPGDLSPPYSFGYWVRLYFSGPGGTGSILTSVVYDDDGSKWLWYGNRDWGLDLTGFRPWAEKAINYSNEIYLDTGFEVIIWDSYLSAYNKGVKSAVITGPGLPTEGVKLEHYYNPDTASQENYFSLTPKSVGYTYSLTDDQISQIPDDAVYTINFYTKTADELTPEDQPVRSENRVISRGPVSRLEIETQGIDSPVYFPSLITPTAHALSAANIGEQLDIKWINPTDPYQMAVNFVSLGWLDNDFEKQYSAKTVYDLRRDDIQVTETLTTTGSASMMAQLYLRGEDAFNRRFTLSWEFWDPAIFPSP